MSSPTRSSASHATKTTSTLRARVNDEEDSGIVTPTRDSSPAKGTRKPPTCKVCGNPRLGHPRQGCPGAPISALDAAAPAPAGPSAISPKPLSSVLTVPRTPTRARKSAPVSHTLDSDSESEAITIALGQLKLAPEDGGDSPRRSASPTKRKIGLAPRVSVPPVMASPREERAEKNARRRSAAPLSKVGTGGTLESLPPDQADVLAGLTWNPVKEEPAVDEERSMLRASSAAKQESLSGQQNLGELASSPLARRATLPDLDEPPTPSSLDRASFLTALTRAATSSPAQLYTLPRNELAHAQAQAEKKGFHAEIAVSTDGAEDMGTLVLGRDANAVRDIIAKLGPLQPSATAAPADQDEAAQIGGGRGTLGLAGGVIIGAVATWAGLAFS